MDVHLLRKHDQPPTTTADLGQFAEFGHAGRHRSHRIHADRRNPTSSESPTGVSKRNHWRKMVRSTEMACGDGHEEVTCVGDATSRCHVEYGITGGRR